jgi:hypothetical protein
MDSHSPLVEEAILVRVVNRDRAVLAVGKSAQRELVVAIERVPAGAREGSCLTIFWTEQGLDRIELASGHFERAMSLRGCWLGWRDGG